MNKKHLWFVVSLTVVVALTLASGLLAGRIRNRWGPSETMLAAAKKLQEVPRQFGGAHNDRWQLQSSETMSDETVEMLECSGNIVRTYANPRTGEEVSVFVIVGPAGPIAVHTPEVCYSSQNYKSRDTRQRVAIADAQGQDDQFWALTFKSKDVRKTCSASIMRGARATAGRPPTTRVSPLPAGRTFTSSSPPAACRLGRT